MMIISRLWTYFINSICYLKFKNPIIINAWVLVKYGRIQKRNWGDELNVYLLEKLTGRRVLVANRSLWHILFPSKKYICIGSVLGWYETEKSEIWGAGALSENVVLKSKTTKVHLVRGKYTRRLLLNQKIDCPEIYGDPALLLSKLYLPKIKKIYSMGIIPHYVDENLTYISDFLDNHKDVCLISMSKYDKWTDVIDLICSCDFIVSSSLHGLIVSDSYGIPNIWTTFSNNMRGNFKYLDYFSSVGRNDSTSIEIENESDLRNLYNKGRLFNFERPIINYDAILDSCPFIEK